MYMYILIHSVYTLIYMSLFLDFYCCHNVITYLQASMIPSQPLYLCLQYSEYVSWCGFPFLGIRSISFICRCMSFAKFEKFSAIISQNFFQPFPSIPSLLLRIQCLDLLLLSHKSTKFYFSQSFFPLLFTLNYFN